MTKDFEQGLRGVLSGAAEGLPGNPDRYEQTAARVRRSRRRTGVAVGAVAAVLVAAGIAIPQFVNMRGLTSGPEDGLVAGTGDVKNLSCPEPTSPGWSKWTGGGALVPEGAVSARFCQGEPAIEGAPPGDPTLTKTTLTHDVDRLVTTLNKLDPANGNPTCTQELGATYNLVLGYPDGRRAVVAFDAYGCGVTKYGDEYRLGGGQLAVLGKRLIRDASAPAGLSCPTDDKTVGQPGSRSSAGDFVPTGAISARLCVRPDDLPQGEVSDQISELVIGEMLAGSIAAELNRLPAIDSGAACTMELGRTYDLLLGYLDGSEVRVTFQAFGCGYTESDGKFRQGGRGLAEFVAARAEEQRLAGPPVERPPALECLEAAKLETGESGMRVQRYDGLVRKPNTAMTVTPEAGKICRYSSTDGRTAKLTARRELTKAQAGELADALNHPAEPGENCDWPAYTGPMDIVWFSDKVGGQYEIRVLRGDCNVHFNPGGDIAPVRPTTLQVIDEIFR